MKSVQVKVKIDEVELKMEATVGENLMEVLMKNKIPISNLCKGNGTCGKCKVKIISGESEITNADNICLNEEEIKKGFRLACKLVLKNDISIEIQENLEEKIVVQAVNIREKQTQENPKCKSAKDYFIAIDIGTTTIAMALVEEESGEVIDTYSGINHQRIYGADVINRIEASNHGKQKELKQLIEEDLWKGIVKLTQSKERKYIEGYKQNKEKVLETKNDLKLQISKPITRIIIAGNTTMLHLLFGYSCESLGKYPFVSDYLSQKECILKDCITISQNSVYEGIPTVILPGISAFVGADIVADLMACPGFDTPNIHLLIDLGTNGEMMLGNKERVLATSVAAGPAFEGGNITHGIASIPGAISRVKIVNQRAVIGTIDSRIPPVGICGTGLISAITQLKANNLMDEQGELKTPYHQKGFSLWNNIEGESVVIFQKDIREFQLAKAALRAGIENLLERFGCKAEDVSKIYLSGGFGTNLKEEDMLETGMLPKEFSGKIELLGNGVLKGIINYGKDIKSRTIEIEKIESVSLALSEIFQENYIKYMNFEI